MTGSALFLDRDGVINVDRGYVHRPDQFEFAGNCGQSALPASFAAPAIQHLNLPLPSAITMARRCSLQLALRAGRLGLEAKIG